MDTPNGDTTKTPGDDTQKPPETNVPSTEVNAGATSNGTGHGPNGNGRNGQFRDENGLTDKMRRALPIIAKHPVSPRAGVMVCQQLKIVHSKTYYGRWTRDPSWLAAFTAIRAEFFDTPVMEGQQMLAIRIHDLINKLIDISMGVTTASRQQVTAIELSLSAAGMDFNKSSNVTNINNINQTVENAQSDFANRLSAKRTDRRAGIPNN